MYFYGPCGIKYIMRKLLRFICAALCLCAVTAGAVVAFAGKQGDTEKAVTRTLTLWQIDSFEGGKGSRAAYLAGIANDFYQGTGTYVKVTSLTADAARANIDSGNVPDMISYGAGFYGIETCVNAECEPRMWCRGAYCMLSLKADWGGATARNTVINRGKDNLATVAALFEGLEKANSLPAQSAYNALLDGQYDYLLGTQRDVVRLQTLGVEFYVEPLSDFCDLFQYMAVLGGGENSAYSADFVDYVIENSDRLYKLSLFNDGVELYEGALHQLENISFSYTVPSLVSSGAMQKIAAAVKSGNINMLKSLLKTL